jgi:hypothetical protein
LLEAALPLTHTDKNHLLNQQCLYGLILDKLVLWQNKKKIAKKQSQQKIRYLRSLIDYSLILWAF